MFDRIFSRDAFILYPQFIRFLPYYLQGVQCP